MNYRVALVSSLGFVFAAVTGSCGRQVEGQAGGAAPPPVQRSAPAPGRDPTNQAGRKSENKADSAALAAPTAAPAAEAPQPAASEPEKKCNEGDARDCPHAPSASQSAVPPNGKPDKPRAAASPISGEASQDQSSGLEIDVAVDTAVKWKPYGRAKEGLRPQADVLNSELKNVRATLSRGQGIVTIVFDYPSQVWTVDRNLMDKTWFTKPLPFLVRVFDRNGQYLSHWRTAELFVPQAAARKVKQDRTWNPLRFQSIADTQYVLLSSANRLEFRMDARVADYAASLEFGFMTSEPVHHDNTWKPAAVD